MGYRQTGLGFSSICLALSIYTLWGSTFIREGYFILLFIIKMKRTSVDTIKVELQKFGESTQFIELPEGATVEDLIDKADLDEGIELRYN